MEKLLESAKEIRAKLEHSNRREDIGYMDDLKPEINNLLHTYLPGSITIRETEIIACLINEIIWEPYKFIKNDQT